MTSDRPIEDPSAPVDPPLSDPALPTLVRERGEPLVEGLEQIDPGSRERGNTIGALAFATAVGLGFTRTEAELCREAAKLEGIGRIYGPDAGPEAGAQLARGAGIPEVVCEWILGISERYDGTGPQGHSGSEIPVFSRIIRTAVLCQDLSAAGGEPAELRTLAGTELDPAMVDALASMLEQAE
jgi:hypothetical protein